MTGSEVMAISFGLCSAAAWGAGDFSGGYASRKGNLFGVVLFSQLLGVLLLAVMAILLSENIPPAEDLFYGFLAGIFGNIGITALYKGLADGRMGIVAPLSAVLTGLIPVCYTAVFAGLPTLTKSAGFFLFLIAIWLFSSGDTEIKLSLKELGLSILAGLGFALFYIFIDKANDQTIFWPLVSARIGSVAFLLLIVSSTNKPVKTARNQWILIGLAGILDASGNAFFSIASHFGRLDVSAVLGSLYPAATVILSFFFLNERIKRHQWVGIFIAFLALIFISI